MNSSKQWAIFARIIAFLLAVAICRGFSAIDGAKFKKFSTQPKPLCTTPIWGGQSRVSILTEIEDQPGSLYEVLKYFWKYEINLTHIESRPAPKNSDGFHIFIDFDGFIGEEKTDRLIRELRGRCRNMLVLDEKEVPWFPRHVSELDKIAPRIKDAGADLQADHPGFHDQTYRTRRAELAKIALQCTYNDDIPIIRYTADETSTWGTIYQKLQETQAKYACEEYLKIFQAMEREVGYSAQCIPQARDISSFLKDKTGFTLRPVAGLLSSRDFLNGLAFRTFFSTQYMRHSSRPLYTPEPDIVHELIGHAPMFADQDFADFSQEIGLASLGASDEDVERLATCYWHSVEFGLLKGKEGKGVKAYGAGLLSSFGELEYACASPEVQSRRPALLPWDPKVAASTAYPITDYQPTYFVAESLLDAKMKMRSFCEALPKPFYARYNTLTSSIWVDRAVRVEDNKAR